MSLTILRLAIILLFSLFFQRVTAQDYTQPQNRIKSIYIYNFIKDIQWPEQSSSEIRICLLERNALFTELEKLVATKNISSKSLTVTQIASLADCRPCSLIFIEEDQVKKDKLKRSDNCTSLIVTSGFYESSMSNIALMFQDNKLQFSINSTLCNTLGYKVSSHLLGLANQKLIQQ
jgi:hypothetical protein